MAAKAPPIPPEQRAFPDQKPDIAGGKENRDLDVNLKEQGQAGNLHQNTHNQGYQQNR